MAYHGSTWTAAPTGAPTESVPAAGMVVAPLRFGDYSPVSDEILLPTGGENANWGPYQYVKFGGRVYAGDGGSWAVDFDGCITRDGYEFWRPLDLHVYTIGGIEYVGMIAYSGGRSWVAPRAWLPAGSIAFFLRSGLGLWDKVFTFHEWPMTHLTFGKGSGNATGIAIDAHFTADHHNNLYAYIGFQTFAIDETTPETVYYGDLAVWKSTTGGWDWLRIKGMFGETGFPADITAWNGAPSMIAAIYRGAASSDRILINGGQTSGGPRHSTDDFSTISTASIVPPALAPRDVVPLWDGTAIGVTATDSGPNSSVSCDRGATWEIANTAIYGYGISTTFFPTIMLVSPSEAIVATRSVPGGGYNIFWTSNGGEDWTFIFELPASFPATQPWLIKVAADSLYLFNSGGDAWFCSQVPTGIATERTAICTGAGVLGKVNPLALCGGVIQSDCYED